MKILIRILLVNAITLAYSAPFYPPNFYLKGPVHKATIHSPDGKEVIISVADAGSISTKGIEGAKFSAYSSVGQADSPKTAGTNCGSNGACGSDSASLEGEGTQYNPSFAQGQGNANPQPLEPNVIIVGPTMTATINGASNTKGCDNGCNKGVGSSYNGAASENIGNDGRYTPEGSASSSDYGKVPYLSDNNEAPNSGSTLGGPIGEVSQNTYQYPSPNLFVEDASSSNNPQDQKNGINNLHSPSIDYSSNSNILPQNVDQTHYNSGSSYLPPTIDGTYESSSFAPAIFEHSDKPDSHQYPVGASDSTHSAGIPSDVGTNKAEEAHPYDFGSGNNGYASSSNINSQVQSQDASATNEGAKDDAASSEYYYESSSFPPATYSNPNSAQISAGGVENLKNYDCYVITFPISSSGSVLPAEYSLFLQKLAAFNSGLTSQRKHHNHHHHRHY